jgi:imidazolonepropionase-like amidohydrolase
MTRWVFDGVMLPEGDSAQVEFGAGPAERLPGRFAVAGLVDAHCHLTVSTDEHGPLLADRVLAESRLDELAAAGVTAVRDLGGERTVTLNLAAEPTAGRPVVAAAGRFIAPPGRYFPRMHRPVTADELLDAVVAEIDDGASWIKLIGDFPATEGIAVIRGSTVEPTYPPELVRAVVEAAHARGARVAAHTNSRVVGELVAAGVDSIEHGTALEPGDLEALADRGGAWTPTLCASVVAGPGETDDARARRRARSEQLAAMLPIAVAEGVRVLTGSDVVGDVVTEIRLLVEHGLTVEQALDAATGSAREYLGFAAADDLVSYDADPRTDPGVLANPAAVIVRGRRIR